MSDYRRLISYMYEYEGKEKGKNVGFVKLETKNGQCRLNLSIKKVYTGGNAAGVYLLGKRVKETFLGNIFIRGGNGDFHAIIDSNNVEGGGNDLKDYYGLTVHDVKNSWRSYTTIWEDAAFPETENDLAGQTQAYEILPGGRKPDPLKAASRIVMELDRELEQECTLQAAAQSIAPESPPQAPPPGIETAPEREPAAVTEQPPQSETPPPGTEAAPEQPPQAPPPGIETAPEREPAAVTEQLPQAESPSGPNQPPQSETTQPPGTETEPEREPAVVTEQPPQAESPSGPNQPPQSETMPPPGTETEPEREPAVVTEQPPQSEAAPPPGPKQPLSEAAPPASEQPSQTTQPYPSPELEDPEVLRYLQDTEDIAANPEKLWQELRSSYPKIQPFEYENGCEILTIRPQDIGRLPRESWVYGNNSFLLHGYYNFRYIILFRLGDKNGRFRYMIGVPGHYYSSEKYMASMFGFPNFVLSKKQPPNDGRFGYWYTDIKLR